MTAKQYWEMLKKIGWLDHVPQSQHVELREQIKHNLDDEDPELTWCALIQGTYEPGGEDTSGTLQTLQEMSRGKFEPENVEINHNRRSRQKCDFAKMAFKNTGLLPSNFRKADFCRERHNTETGVTKIAFRLGGKNFAGVLPEDSLDYFVALLDLANKAVESTGAAERFILLPPVDFFNVIFMPPAVHRAAVAAGLVPPEFEIVRHDD